MKSFKNWNWPADNAFAEPTSLAVEENYLGDKLADSFEAAPSDAAVEAPEIPCCHWVVVDTRNH